MTNIRSALLKVLLVLVATLSLGAINSHMFAATAEDLKTSSEPVLQTSYKSKSVANDISRSSKVISVVPNVIKAGLVFGGNYADGILSKHGYVYPAITISYLLPGACEPAFCPTTTSSF